ncbi:4972_t:CDS:2 [Paraglomus brasilianum]|uniref:DNA repair protein RAD14 n=1 Tax=Paraglomus brasilianum TaxID=144538 RepID=A0A9N9G623_9GLOM|nr:4972_t:CDS:2 [Paraglomus brasilianum]
MTEPNDQATTSDSARNSSLTPEQIKRIEENRLKAKAKLLAKSTNAPQSSNNTTTITSSTPASKKDVSSQRPIRPIKAFTNYYDYDLSQMVDSRGGFLVEDNDTSTAAEKRKSEQNRPKPIFDPPLSIDPAENPTCKECGSMEIDYNWKQVFGVCVCQKCKEAMPEKFSLLTKTECKEDYLLTDPELRDTEVLPHLAKPNPHNSTWNDMMLYLREQVEAFAFNKWGGAEGLDKEYERRQHTSKKRKEAKFKAKMADMRKRTRTEVIEKKRNQTHKHSYGTTVTDPKTGTQTQTCTECGLTIEVFEF